jgi:hypothetical protein
VEGSCEDGNEPLGSIKCWEVLDNNHIFTAMRTSNLIYCSAVLYVFVYFLIVNLLFIMN